MKVGASAAWIVFSLTAAVFAFFLWARWQERTAVFFPAREITDHPGRHGIAFEDVSIQSGNSILHGWLVPGTNPMTVLWLHGNAGNVADRTPLLADLTRRLGTGSLLFDYRGYGRSTGVPSEAGLYEDAAAAFRFLVREKGIEPSTIVIYGHSLGAAPAIALALGEGKRAAGLVLESAFTSARDMARLVYPRLPVGFFMTLKLDNIGLIGRLEIPLLVIHGQADATIPFQMGQRLFEAAPQPKRFLPLPLADHSDGYQAGGERYWKGWEEFLGTLTGADS